MPSVSARRKTREFGVVKGADGARVLRSGRRVLTESVEKKQRGGAYDGNEWYSSKAKNSPKNHGNKENGWANGAAKVKKQVVPRVKNAVVNKKVAKKLPKNDPKSQPKKVEDESLDPSGGTDGRFGIVYCRKRKRVFGVEKGETLRGKRFRLQFSRRQRRNERLVRSTPEFSVVVRGGGLDCFLGSVLRCIRRSSLEVSELADFLLTEPISSVFASVGIQFLKDPPSVRTGICRFFAPQQFVPMLSVDFSAIPLCFAEMHLRLSFRPRFLSLEPVNNSLDDDELDETISNSKVDDSCIQMETETAEAKTVVPKVDNSCSSLVAHPSVRASKLAVRNIPYRNGLSSRGVRKRRSSGRGRKARNATFVGMRGGDGALVSDLISSRRNGIPFSSVVSKNKLRSSVRGKSAPSLEVVGSTVLAETSGMDSSKLKLRSSLRRSSVANVKEATTAAAAGTQDMGMATCSANVLVIDFDRCFRIKDASIVLETSDSGEWVLVVKKDGTTRYTHSAQKVMKPCSSNRVTHDILWSVDDNLKLEFPNRQDWLIFKDLYKECYDRNVPSSASKAIPVPGVCEVFGYEGFSAPFSRPSAYICIKNDELARALARRTANYDMDSEDEEWLKKLNDAFSVETDHLSEDKFELMIDFFERASYCGMVEFDEEAVMNQCQELGRRDLVEAVYGYWMRKRKQKRAPLLRVFQAYQAKKPPVVPRPVLRKRRSFKRQASQCGRGKQPSVLLANLCLVFYIAMAAEQEALEEQNARLKVEEAKASAMKAVELAIAKRRRAQLLMENADLAVFKAAMALEIADDAHGSANVAVPLMTEGCKDL
ncbi:hypothetical protein Tsubulata_036270 [Turnera subulata]|uniref:Enhancer of polycomb-like protein n=1 Tax=Turnera subulata TaxID=218843 RepID=A0A9Q0JGG8_9ROSI|nr:hypothetical protein Tsubulata_036270 [Turnera subulata]